MFPPTIVCSAAPRFPITLRERTTIPRTTPKFLTMRYPGSSIAVVTIPESTRPCILGFSFAPRAVCPIDHVNRCDSTRYMHNARAAVLCYARLAWTVGMDVVFEILAAVQILLGLYLAFQGALWLAYAKRRTLLDPGFYAPRTAVICPCRGIEQ